MADIGIYKMVGDVATKDKVMIGTRHNMSQTHEWIKTIKPAARDEVANPIEANKTDKTCCISKAFGVSVNDRGQHLLVDATEVLCIFSFYVAGQAEEMFAAGGPMVGALACVQSSPACRWAR